MNCEKTMIFSFLSKSTYLGYAQSFTTYIYGIFWEEKNSADKYKIANSKKYFFQKVHELSNNIHHFGFWIELGSGLAKQLTYLIK